VLALFGAISMTTTRRIDRLLTLSTTGDGYSSSVR
jgi:hypothetical protein